jgi:opacity protein-like surface antigen
MRYALWGAVATLLAVSSSNAGQRNWYIGLEAGMSDLGAGGGYATPPASFPFFFESSIGDLDESIRPMATIGTYVGDWRIEAEFAHRSGEYYDIDVTQTTAMLNVAYDIGVINHLSVTLGAGVGADFISLETPVADGDTMSLAYQGLVGLSYELTDSTDVTLSYRYFDTLDVDISETTPAGSASLRSADDRTISLGLRFAL